MEEFGEEVSFCLLLGRVLGVIFRCDIRVGFILYAVRGKG